MPGHHGRLGLRSVSRIGIYQHSMRVALGAASGPDLSDLSSTVYDVTSDTVTGGPDYQGINFSEDGITMTVSQDASAKIITYTLTGAFDISTRGTTPDETTDKWEGDTGFDRPNCHRYSADGTVIVGVTSGDDKVHWATLSTPWDLSTAGAASSSSIVGDGTIPVGLDFDSDGLAMFISYNSDNVKKYTLSTPYDPSSRGSGTVVLDLTTNQTGGGQGIAFAPDGMKFYSVDITDDQLDQYNLTAPYDLTTASFQSGQAITIADAGHGMFIRKDGSEIYVTHNSANKKIERWA